MKHTGGRVNMAALLIQLFSFFWLQFINILGSQNLEILKMNHFNDWMIHSMNHLPPAIYVGTPRHLVLSPHSECACFLCVL